MQQQEKLFTCLFIGNCDALVGADISRALNERVRVIGGVVKRWEHYYLDPSAGPGGRKLPTLDVPASRGDSLGRFIARREMVFRSFETESGGVCALGVEGVCAQSAVPRSAISIVTFDVGFLQLAIKRDGKKRGKPALDRCVRVCVTGKVVKTFHFS